MGLRSAFTPAMAVLAAALCATPAAAQYYGDSSFDGVQFGATSAELLQQFGTRATRLDRPLDYGDAYVDVVLRRHELGGYPFIVYFQMDKSSRMLKRIQIERPRHGAVPMVHQGALAALTARYGAPAHTCTLRVPKPGGQAIEERIWRHGDVVVRLVFREQSLGVLERRQLDSHGSEAWDLSLEGLPQQLFVRLAPAEAEPAGCGRGR